VVHLENPTLTLCIRTVEDTQLNQWHHLSSGLSYTKYNLKEVNVKQILYFQYMYHSNSLTALKYLNELLTRMEASATLSLYESVFANEFGLDPVVSDIIIEHINNLCHEELWFQKFINHYDDLAYHLMEFNASSGDLKLLAHGLNFNFSAESIKNLLGYTENQELQQLTSKLLEEQTIFNDEYYGDQVQKINGFMYKLGDN